MGAIKGRHAIFAVLALVVVAIATAGGWQLAYLRLLGEQERQLFDRLTVSQRSVASEIERFRYLPDVVGQDERIVRLLRQQDASAAIAAANAYLQTVRGMSGADELYVLDLGGNTLAASNWNEPGSFLGHNYAFRPYFRDALAQGSGRFYAVGVTTGKPGYFLSSRIEAGGRALGVAVAKVDMSPLAATWAQAGELSGLADSDGVVFLSGEPRWTYRPLRPLGGTSLTRIAEERRYDGIDLSQAIPLGLPVDREGSVRLTFDDLPYIVDARSIEPDGWQLVSALPLQPVEREARLTGGIAGLVALMLFALVALWRQRRQITRLKLEQAGVLELRVAERTQALAHEIEERRRAEAELRATQESLVHAAKLAALGQMSAAIVHEVSQPLSALDNTLAAADLHAQREATSQVRRNLGTARNLLRRMQRTVKHLRSFSSRRDPGPPEAVDVSDVLDAAIEIVSPQARDAAIGIVLDVAPNLPPVAGNAVRLEQVFINLTLNALEATAAAANQRVDVSARLVDDCVLVEVNDAGPGIAEAAKERLFEPFFTTKTTGESLGLGLSITRTLLEQFGGSLRFSPRAGGGTCAAVSLPLFSLPHASRQFISA